MEKRWSRKFDACRNCLTIRSPHKASGYCSDCYPLIKKLAEIELWELEKTETLKGYPKDMMLRNPYRFEKVKKGYTRQLKERLDRYKAIEERLRGPVSGLYLEWKIREVADLSGVNGTKLFFGDADVFSRHFDAYQRRVLYEMLNRITENTRWRGIDWERVSNETEKKSDVEDDSAKESHE